MVADQTIRTNVKAQLRTGSAAALTVRSLAASSRHWIAAGRLRNGTVKDWSPKERPSFTSGFFVPSWQHPVHPGWICRSLPGIACLIQLVGSACRYQCKNVQILSRDGCCSSLKRLGLGPERIPSRPSTALTYEPALSISGWKAALTGPAVDQSRGLPSVS